MDSLHPYPFLREVQLRCPPALGLGSSGKSPVNPVAVIAHTATVLLEGALGISGFDGIILIFHVEYPPVQKRYRPEWGVACTASPLVKKSTVFLALVSRDTRLLIDWLFSVLPELTAFCFARLTGALSRDSPRPKAERWRNVLCLWLLLTWLLKRSHLGTFCTCRIQSDEGTGEQEFCGKQLPCTLVTFVLAPSWWIWGLVLVSVSTSLLLELCCMLQITVVSN